MPSQIGNAGNIVNIAANYLVAKPSTQFGTRQLSVLSIGCTGIETDYADSNSLFSQAVRALQQTAEVWAVFTPTTNSFNVIIATDTQWAGDTAHQGAVNGGSLPTQAYGVLEAALDAGTTGSQTFTVAAVAGFVAPFHG